MEEFAGLRDPMPHTHYPRYTFQQTMGYTTHQIGRSITFVIHSIHSLLTSHTYFVQRFNQIGVLRRVILAISTKNLNRPIR